MMYHCWNSKDVHRTKYQVLTIVRLTHSQYTTKIARMRCYTMTSTILSAVHGVQTYSKCVREIYLGE